MTEHYRALFGKYRRRGLLLDSNILLLFFVGSFDRNRIAVFKRTEQFAEEDYDLLLAVLRRFEVVVTTPNILTEVSNLAGQLAEGLRQGFFEKFAAGVLQLHEEYVVSTDVVPLPAFARYGLTDTGISLIAPQRYLVLTDDFRLSGYLAVQGVDVINFNHLRFTR